MLVQRAWRTRNAYKHGITVADISECALRRRVANGIDARA